MILGALILALLAGLALGLLALAFGAAVAAAIGLGWGGGMLVLLAVVALQIHRGLRRTGQPPRPLAGAGARGPGS